MRLNELTIPVLDQGRALSACTSDVLVPFANAPIPMPELPQIDGQSFAVQSTRGLVGLSGESRLSDGNLSYFHGQATAPPVPGVNPFVHPSGNAIRPAPPPDNGRSTPAHRPDIPCEIQEPPNMNAPGGPTSAFAGGARRNEFSSADRRKLERFKDIALKENKKLRDRRARRERSAEQRGADKSDRAGRARENAEAKP